MSLIVACGSVGGVALAGDMSNQEQPASITFSDQETDGETVVVDSVTLDDGGFVSVKENGELLGVSEYLEPGTHEDVTIALDVPIEGEQRLSAIAHQDTDGDMAFSFMETNGDEDHPYTADGEPVYDRATVTVTDHEEDDPTEPEASVTFSDQESDGTTVLVDEVELSDGGFVTIHDERLQAGEVVESVIGVSEYLDAGTHENVEVTLFADVPGAEFEQDALPEGDNLLVAMPHLDTNDNEQYDFVETAGAEDGPYVDADGEIVDDEAIVTASPTEPPEETPTPTPDEPEETPTPTPDEPEPEPEASVTFSDQESDGTTVLVDEVELSDGGFVTIHDETLLEGDALGSVVGVSEYLEPGVHENVEVTLFADVPGAEFEQDALPESDTLLIAMPHLDTNDNEQYDFVETAGAEDGPYVDADGEAVVDDATVTVAVEEPEETPTPTPTPDEPEETPTPTPEEPEETPTPTPDEPEEPIVDDELDDRITIQNVSDVRITVVNVYFENSTILIVGDGMMDDHVMDEDAVDEDDDVMDEDDDVLDEDESFEVTDLNVTENVAENETITLEATIENPNEFEATQDVDLRLNGEVIASTSVTLDANESGPISFETTTADLDGLQIMGIYTDQDGQNAAVTLPDRDGLNDDDETDLNDADDTVPAIAR